MGKDVLQNSGILGGIFVLVMESTRTNGDISELMVSFVKVDRLYRASTPRKELLRPLMYKCQARKIRQLLGIPPIFGFRM